MKRLIKNHQSQNLPKGLSTQILKEADRNNDRQLDFEEFYNLSLQHEWLFQSYIQRYCHLIVPRRGVHHTATDGSGDSVTGDVVGMYRVVVVVLFT